MIVNVLNCFLSSPTPNHAASVWNCAKKLLRTSLLKRRNFLGFFGNFRVYGPIWAHMGPIWAHKGPYGPLWAHMGPIWAHMGPYTRKFPKNPRKFLRFNSDVRSNFFAQFHTDAAWLGVGELKKQFKTFTIIHSYTQDFNTWDFLEHRIFNTWGF